MEIRDMSASQVAFICHETKNPIPSYSYGWHGWIWESMFAPSPIGCFIMFRSQVSTPKYTDPLGELGQGGDRALRHRGTLWQREVSCL